MVAATRTRSGRLSASSRSSSNNNNNSNRSGKANGARKASAATGRTTHAKPSIPSTASPSPRKRVKREEDGGVLPPTPPRTPRVKKERESPGAAEGKEGTPGSSYKTVAALSDRKLASLRASLDAGPFPDWVRPTESECMEVAQILTRAHGYKTMPTKQPPRGDDRYGGCGDVADVLDALVRTILSCNTSGSNSRAAHKSLCDTFGRCNWEAIVDAKHAAVAESIRCGGLHDNKARTIQGVLQQTRERHGKLSLDHLHQADQRAAMEELVSFKGVGPKVAACVAGFCLSHPECAVDTHVHRLARKLGWVPDKASRDQTYYHLKERIPDNLKYSLHVLLIKHGKACSACSARGFATDRYQSPEWEKEGMSVISGVKKEAMDDDGANEDGASPRKYESVKCPLAAAGAFSRRKSNASGEKANGGRGGLKREQDDLDAELERKPTVKAEAA